MVVNHCTLLWLVLLVLVRMVSFGRLSSPGGDYWLRHWQRQMEEW